MSKSSQSEPTSSTELTEEKEPQKPSLSSEDGESIKNGEKPPTNLKEEGLEHNHVDLQWLLLRDLRLVPDAILKENGVDTGRFRALAETMQKNPCKSILYGLNEQKIIQKAILVRYDLFDEMAHLSDLLSPDIALSNREFSNIHNQITAMYGKCLVVRDSYTDIKQNLMEEDE